MKLSRPTNVAGRPNEALVKLSPIDATSGTMTKAVYTRIAGARNATANAVLRRSIRDHLSRVASSQGAEAHRQQLLSLDRVLPLLDLSGIEQYVQHATVEFAGSQLDEAGDV